MFPLDLQNNTTSNSSSPQIANRKSKISVSRASVIAMVMGVGLLKINQEAKKEYKSAINFPSAHLLWKIGIQVDNSSDNSKLQYFIVQFNRIRKGNAFPDNK